MPKTKFEGTSARGDINEALQNAIGAAKDGLKSEQVEWRLEELSGVNGGFVPQNDITVRIHARRPGRK